jgi:hypothetical protein
LTVLDDYLNHAQALERERGMEPGEAWFKSGSQTQPS